MAPTDNHILILGTCRYSRLNFEEALEVQLTLGLLIRAPSNREIILRVATWMGPYGPLRKDGGMEDSSQDDSMYGFETSLLILQREEGALEERPWN